MKKWQMMILILLMASSMGASAQQTPKELRISAIPDENPQELLRIYAPFADYLTKEIGVPVKFTPVVDYAATVEGLAANKLDMVWYGGLTSVQAARRATGSKRIIMRKEDTAFKSQFITRKDAGVRELKDLRGKTFSFGSVSSTSGHLMPRYYLMKAGINPEKDFLRFSFSGAHDATAAWVEAGRVDAGALNFLVWDKLVNTKKVDTHKVVVFWTTPAYVDYVWTVRAGLNPSLVEKISQAFLKLDYQNPEHRKLLDLHRTKGYLPARDEQWKSLEDAAITTGLIHSN